MAGALRTAAALAAATALASAAPAGATVVFEHGSEVRAIEDDGSNERTLVAPPAGGQGSFGDPHVDPAGTDVVMVGSRVGSYSCYGTVHFGYDATAVYRWRAGQLSRLAPQHVPDNCTSSMAVEPEATSDGRVIREHFQCTGSLFQHDYTCVTRLWSTDIDGNDPRDFGSRCDSLSDMGARAPSPNPADGGEVAYVGCSTSNNALIRSRASRNGETPISVDDAEQEDPSWRSDGGRIVVLEGEGEPGIWTYNRNPATLEPHHLLTQPAGVTFDSPRYMGAAQDRILFAAQGDLWTVPASCTATACSFPASAQRLTFSGQNEAPAWTSRALSSGSGGGDGGTGPRPGPGGGGGSDTSAPTLSLPRLGARSFRAARRGASIAAAVGTRVSYSLSEPGTVSFSAERAAAGVKSGRRCVKARRGKRGRRCTLYTKVRGSFAHSGKSGSNIFRFTGRLRGRALKPGNYRLVAVASDAAGNRSSPKRSAFRIVR